MSAFTSDFSTLIAIGCGHSEANEAIHSEQNIAFVNMSTRWFHVYSTIAKFISNFLLLFSVFVVAFFVCLIPLVYICRALLLMYCNLLYYWFDLRMVSTIFVEQLNWKSSRQLLSVLLSSKKNINWIWQNMQYNFSEKCRANSKRTMKKREY